MKISVIVPTFNRADLLPDALDSVICQSLTPHETIVVDDGSTDGTQDIVERYATDSGSMIRGLVQENRGKAAALNHALGHVRGTHVLILDDDDILLPQALETHRDLLQSCDNASAFSYGPNIYFENRTQIDAKFAAWDASPWGVPNDRLFMWALESFRFHQGAMLVPRALYLQVGSFDETALRSQDYEMILRLCRRFEGRPVQTPVLACRNHGGLRGPAAVRHSAKQSFAVWRHYDFRVLRAVRNTVPVAEFLGKEAARHGAVLSGVQERKALIQRAVIMSRRGLFAEAIEDMDAAARSSDALDTPLDDDEMRLLGSGLELARYATMPPGTFSFFTRAARPYWRLGGRPAARLLLQRLYWSFSERLAARRARDATTLFAAMMLASGQLIYRWPFARS